MDVSRGEKGENPLADMCDVVVIGAGFAGLYAIHKLNSLGYRVIAFEKGDDVGGVWYWNRYPGARCDCESYYYSYAFSKSLQQDWDWSLRYSEQPEILDYLRHVADRFDLRRHIRFGAPVTRTRFDATAGAWRVTSADGRSVVSRFVVTAARCLSQMQVPDLPGLDAFEGRILWTAAWPKQPIDFTGRRVGIIGTGASAVQAIPRIADKARRLTVLQRTASWVLPARNAATAAEFDRWVKVNYDEIRERCRNSYGAVPFEGPTRSAFDVSDEERRAVYQKLWDIGGMRFFSSFNDLFTDPAANETAQDFVRDHINAVVRDPVVAALLTPVGQPIGVKRPPVDDDYYETFNRDNVELVDLRAAPITGFAGLSLITTAQPYELDDLILATGFDAMTGALLGMDITGQGGVRLSDHWRQGPCAYLGLAMAGFPNLVTVTGPLSPSVLANTPTAVEQHVDWIADCLDHMRARGLRLIEATRPAEQAWVSHSDEVVEPSLYSGSNSWYFGSNIPGKPRRFSVYLGGFANYRERCEAVARNGYEGFRFA
jgi:cation diffusion facilitator CzcD-associated flavoprotein CzcO